MRRVNLFSLESGPGLDRDGYRRTRTEVGKALGAVRIGFSLYELPKDQRTFPYHFHHGMEEWAIVVDGTPTLRSPAGERQLRRGDVVCFPAGTEGAHQLAGPGSVLLLSSNRVPETIEYPDSGKVGLNPPGKLFFARDAADYWDGE